MDGKNDAADKFKENAKRLTSYIVQEIRKLNAEQKANIAEVVLAGIITAVGIHDKHVMIDHFIRLTWQPSNYVTLTNGVEDGAIWDGIFGTNEQLMKQWLPIILENILVTKKQQLEQLTSTMAGMSFNPDIIQKDIKTIFISHMNEKEIKDQIWTFIRYMLISSIKYIWYARDPILCRENGEDVKKFVKPNEYDGVKIMKYIREHNISVDSRVISS